MTSISAERASLARLGGGLILRHEWGSRFDYGNSRTVTEPARQIFIHVTVTNPGAYRSHAAHIRAIEAIGMSRFPNTGGSYNRVVVAGVTRAYELQPVGRRGAHTVNDFRRSTCNRWGAACPGHGGDLTAPSWNNNYTARSYAYGANVHHSVPGSVLDTLARAIAGDIKAGFVRRDAEIHGHRCVSSKSCPGDRMWAQMHSLRRRVDDYLEDDMTPEQERKLDRVLAAVDNGHDTLNASLHPDTDGPKMSAWAWSRIPQHFNPRVAPILGYILGDTRAALDVLGKVLANQQAIMQSTGVEVDEAELGQQIAAVLVPAVVAELSDVTDAETEAVMERVLRRVLGGLDDD